MSKSALIGQPPATIDDRLIMRGYARTLGVPDNILDPSELFRRPTVTSLPSDANSISQGPNIIMCMSLAIALICLMTGTRICLRVVRKDLRIGYDDFVIIPAAIGAISWYSMTVVLAIRGGAGKHIYDITYFELSYFYKLAGLSQTIFFITVTLTAISITLSITRPMALTSTPWTLILTSFLILLTTFLLTTIFVTLFQCSPPTIRTSLVSLGNRPHPPKCLDPTTLYTILGILHSIISIALLTLSVFFLHPLRMSSGTKLRLPILFLAGSISCIASVLRPIFSNRYEGDTDLTYVYTRQMICSAIEIFFAFLASSLPVLSALLPQSRRGEPWVMGTPRLTGLSVFNFSTRARNPTSTTLGSDLAIKEGVNGALTMESVRELDKDSFTGSTQWRWEEAFETLCQSNHHEEKRKAGIIGDTL